MGVDFRYHINNLCNSCKGGYFFFLVDILQFGLAIRKSNLILGRLGFLHIVGISFLLCVLSFTFLFELHMSKRFGQALQPVGL